MTRLCFIGASNTEGMGDGERRGWVGRLALTLPPADVVFNLGIRGQTIFEIAERAEAECRVRLPAGMDGRIVLGAPLNEHARLEDGTPRAARADILACYASLLAGLRAIAPVAVVGPPPVEASRMPFHSAASGLTLTFRNPDIAGFDTDLRALCEAAGLAYIDLFAALLGTPAYMEGLKRNDGLHSDAAGYGAVAAHIAGHAAWAAFLSVPA